MKKILCLLFLSFFLISIGSAENDTGEKKLKLVYHYTKQPNDTIRFPSLIKSYEHWGSMYRIECVEAKDTTQKKIEVLNPEGELIGIIWGTPTSSFLEEIYQKYYSRNYTSNYKKP